MGWHGRLSLAYEYAAGTTVSRSRHHGPMRVLSSLYPEGRSICHQVLVHPPGGLVHGDVLELEVELRESSHVVITTPGATRFYRSGGDAARQVLHAKIASSARLEWLPLETICHRGTRAENELLFELAPGAEMIGWDTLALGLPASGEAFDRGSMHQQIHLPGIWLERALIDGKNRRLLDGPLGWAGHGVLATIWFSRGDSIDHPLRQQLLELARELAGSSTLAATAGASSPDSRLVVLRVLAARVEPVLTLLGQIRAAWRRAAWNLDAHPPRIWRT